MKSSSRRGTITRREFVRNASAAVAAGTALGVASEPAPAQPAEARGEMPRRVLGKTEFEVSVVCFGSFGLTNPGVLDAALDAGVNLIDVGPGYGEGNAERAIGEVMKRRREEAVLSTKFTVMADTSKGELLNQLEGSLKRLQTDRIDVMQVAMVDSVEPFRNPALYAALKDAQDAGKIRFLGFSAHGGNLPAVVAEGIQHDEIAAMLVKYNFMEYENLADLVAQAHEKNIGVIGMKLRAGARDGDLKEFSDGVDLAGATVRWALSNPNVTSVCCAMLSFEDVRKYTGLATQPVTEADLDVLCRYRERFGRLYCRSCGTCQVTCPYNVAVAEIMRYAMYFRYYGFEKEAMRLYAHLPQEATAAPCASCDGLCTDSCPYGLAPREHLLEAHRMLT